MKKFWIALVGSTLVTPVVEAQYIREDSYQVYQEPYVARSYGQPNWSYVRAPQNYQRPVYQNAPVAYPYQRQAYQEEDISKIASPVYKRFYATLRAGMGGTFGWDKNENAGKVSNPTGAILSFSLGTYLKPNVRVDAEFAYHTKDTLYSGKDAYLEGKGRYSQYDFGLNAYYDFETDSKIRPFIGIGVWGISSKVTSSVKS
ncbi:MAG: opacity family porin, partial [Alphaproteobacteria bacterium]